MANTAYLRYEVEPFVRQELAAQYGVRFEPKTIVLKSGGTRGFDAVSEDGKIVVGIKACALSSGKLKAGQTKNAISELWYLSLVDAPIRALILTNRPFFDAFAKEMKGRLNPDISIDCIELLPEMQDEVNRIIAEASREVTPAAREEIIADATAENVT